MEDLDFKEIRKARRRRLTERLETLRERMYLLEEELKPFMSDFFRVSIFGSARIQPDDELYAMTQRLARALGHEGIDVVTGGGPGLMEAASKGVQEGKREGHTRSKAYGLSIQGGRESGHGNEHLDIKQHHKRFSSRLDDFMRLSNVLIATPGGIGTLLELFFSWQLLQVRHMSEKPIILIKRDFWMPLIDWIKEKQVAAGLVSAADLRFVTIVDTYDEAMEIVKAEHQKFLAVKIARGDGKLGQTKET